MKQKIKSFWAPKKNSKPLTSKTITYVLPKPFAPKNTNYLKEVQFINSSNIGKNVNYSSLPKSNTTSSLPKSSGSLFSKMKAMSNFLPKQTKPKLFAIPNNSHIQSNLGKPVQFIKTSGVPRKQMNWVQAKTKYPKLNPYGDIDKDGVMNMFDCKPFDKMLQEEITKRNKTFKGFTKEQIDKLEKEQKELQNRINKMEGRNPAEAVAGPDPNRGKPRYSPKGRLTPSESRLLGDIRPKTVEVAAPNKSSNKGTAKSRRMSKKEIAEASFIGTEFEGKIITPADKVYVNRGGTVSGVSRGAKKRDMFKLPGGIIKPANLKKGDKVKRDKEGYIVQRTRTSSKVKPEVPAMTRQPGQALVRPQPSEGYMEKGFQEAVNIMRDQLARGVTDPRELNKLKEQLQAKDIKLIGGPLTSEEKAAIKKREKETKEAFKKEKIEYLDLTKNLPTKEQTLRMLEIIEREPVLLKPKERPKKEETPKSELVIDVLPTNIKRALPEKGDWMESQKSPMSKKVNVTIVKQVIKPKTGKQVAAEASMFKEEQKTERAKIEAEKFKFQGGLTVGMQTERTKQLQAQERILALKLQRKPSDKNITPLKIVQNLSKDLEEMDRKFLASPITELTSRDIVLRELSKQYGARPVSSKKSAKFEKGKMVTYEDIEKAFEQPLLLIEKPITLKDVSVNKSGIFNRLTPNKKVREVTDKDIAKAFEEKEAKEDADKEIKKVMAKAEYLADKEIKEKPGIFTRIKGMFKKEKKDDYLDFTDNKIKTEPKEKKEEWIDYTGEKVMRRKFVEDNVETRYTPMKMEKEKGIIEDKPIIEEPEKEDRRKGKDTELGGEYQDWTAYKDLTESKEPKEEKIKEEKSDKEVIDEVFEKQSAKEEYDSSAQKLIDED